MLKPKQKMFLHIYKDAADLSDARYREILSECSGCRSAADRKFGQPGFERAMAALETILFTRVADGLVDDPLGNSKWIRSDFYWRKRLPEKDFINTRQAKKIQVLWDSLQEHLPWDKRNVDYLSRIIRKATGKRDVGYSGLKTQEAAFLINALRDRLSYAIKQAEKVPF